VNGRGPGLALGGAPQSASFRGLVDRLFGELGRLLDQKLALLKLEIKTQVAAAIRHSALAVVGALVAALGGFLLAVAAALGLGELVGAAGGFAIVGGVCLGAGGGLLMTMSRQLRQQSFVPKKTIEELRSRRDGEWIKTEL
jgi:hypothetical protein